MPRMPLSTAIHYSPEFNLIPHLSVAENIFIGREPIKGWPARIDFEQMNAATAEILRSFNLDLKPTDIFG